MLKKRSKDKIRKLDNASKIFSLDDITSANTFRYSVILKEEIDEHSLKKALSESLKNHSALKVKIATGLFWNYLELNEKEPIIEEDNKIICTRIDFKKNNDYLFKITYYKNKINLDVFHALTDGIGAIQFLKSLIHNYLSIKYNLSFKEKITHLDINYQDQYLKNYDKTIKIKSNSKPSYQIPGKTNKKLNKSYHYIINIEELKKICKNHNVTITEYLTATYIYAIYSSIYNKDSKEEIIISVPIDLRGYYQVDTLSNFFVCMNINPKIVEKNLTTFDEILKQVHKEFKKNLNIDKIKNYLTKDVKLGKNIFIHIVPLVIKKKFMKYAGNLVSKSTTSTLSNVGCIDIDKDYKKYIDNILVAVIPGKIQKIKCTICSFDNKLNIAINSNLDNQEFEETFFKLLENEINNIKVESNNYIDLS